MGLLNIITQACTALTAVASPSIDALGVRMVIALATIMLVWFGAQEALSGVSGGPGFSMGRFISLFMQLTFAYVFVAFYDSAIPGIGLSLKSFINGGAQYLVTIIGNDGVTQMQATLAQAQSVAGPGILKAISDPYFAIVAVVIQILLAIFATTLSLIVAYGVLASTVVGLLGPVLIPWMVFEKTSFLFWGWLRAFIGYCFYKVVAAAVLFVLSQLLATYAAGLPSVTDPGTMVQQFPILIGLVLVNVYILFQVPHLTHAIFSGSTGGGGSGMTAGLFTAATLASRV
jgi:hypothetical protein